MAWYNAGTITVTNGSAVVTGAGTDFVTNVAARDALLVAGGNPLEIASVQSATQLTLASPWLGATGGGQSYKVQPTVGIYVDLALRALNMLTPFQAVLDGIGQGLIPVGTLAAPGLRFAVDQDTGFRRPAENQLALVAGGVDRLIATVDGVSMPMGLVAGSGLPTNTGAISTVHSTSDPADIRARVAWGTDGSGYGFAISRRTSGGITDVMSFRDNGFVGIGTGTPATRLHLLGDALIASSSPGNAASSSASAVRVHAHSSTGRSISAGGTINASGADYAEYMVKADGCGTIEKGDVCGVDRDGRLTRTWADAVRYVVKSTDPNLVGGDTWLAHLPERPTPPGEQPIAPVSPPPSTTGDLPAEPVREDDEQEIDFIRRMAGYLVTVSSAAAAATADREALLAYQAAAAAYPAAKAAHDAALAAYEADVIGWETALEEARVTVDRIAFSGQVPVNVTEEALAVLQRAFADGEAVYLVAVARGGGIGAHAVRESDMTLPLYMRRLGVLWAIRDGRPIIDVQHG